MTISLLIPVCDYDIVALVHSMKSCIGKIPEFIEILIGDDGSFLISKINTSRLKNPVSG